jgi:hypothetical protein
VNATELTVTAKMRSLQRGVVPRSIELVSASTLTTSKAPTTMIASCSAMSTSTSAATPSRSAPMRRPETLRSAT